MEALDTMTTVAMRPVTRLFDLADPLSLVSLVAALAFALFFAAAMRIRAGRAPARLGAFFRFAFPKRVLAHRSSILDYKLFVTNTILMTAVLGFFVVGADVWQGWTAAALGALFGPAATGGAPSWGVFCLTTLVQILALDFGYYAAHYAFHSNPVLWEFHKVHHSAEVMTPATELRQHPVELVAFPVVYGFTTGVTYAVMVHVFGPEAQRLGIHGQTAILMAHLLTFHHLRHSHVAMPFTGLWGRILHSPAHHQIHHSADPVHHDRNMGYLFSVWDWAFGTLHMPRAGEKLTLGIGEEGHTHRTVTGVMWTPFVKAFRLIALPGETAAAEPEGDPSAQPTRLTDRSA